MVPPQDSTGDVIRTPSKNLGHVKKTSTQVTSQEAERSLAEVDCYTCRRRRIRCDRHLPSCRKCLKTKRECLGYTKPLVWNKGVASRGKMMGKTFGSAKSSANVSVNVSVVTHAPREIEAEVSDVEGVVTVTTAVESGLSNRLFDFLPRTLNDPLLQDLRPLTRYYIDYYSHKVSPETVLYDLGDNPFRDILSSISSSPLLLKTVLATAASHASNAELHTPVFTIRSLSMPAQEEARSSVPMKPACYHALSYKQSALQQLQSDLRDPQKRKENATVASILLFIWLEMIESGKDTWRVHLDGAKDLIESLHGQPLSGSLSLSHKDPNIYPVGPPLHNYFVDSCIMFEIMGTTLARPYAICNPIAPSEAVYRRLKQSEALSFLGCPAELLFMIMAINHWCWTRTQKADAMNKASTAGSAHTSLDVADQADGQLFTSGSIVERIQTFDNLNWAMQTQTQRHHHGIHSDLPQRVHLASAYQSAVLLYAVRVFGLPTDQDIPVEKLVESLTSDLAAIPPSDPFFKCLLWPTFVCGAESITEDQRAFVRSNLRNFAIEFNIESAGNAQAILDEIWEIADASKANGAETGNWMEFLAHFEGDWLFI